MASQQFPPGLARATVRRRDCRTIDEPAMFSTTAVSRAAGRAQDRVTSSTPGRSRHAAATPDIMLAATFPEVPPPDLGESRHGQRQAPNRKASVVRTDIPPAGAQRSRWRILTPPPPPPRIRARTSRSAPPISRRSSSMELIKQEVSRERWIAIPDEVRDVYRLWRPTPLYRARRLEKALDTPARIYYKYEGVSPAGSHKPNTAVAAGLLQQEGKASAPAQHGDRRRPVGLARWRMACQMLRPAVQGLHGEGLVPAEALPAHPDGDVGRAGRRQPAAPTPRPARRSSSRIRSRRAASASPSARRSRTPPRARTPSTRSAACSTTSSCTRR